jgi:Domain of unknown function (DUF4845)
MHSKQRGVTLIGWLFLLIPVAILLYACIRLAPVYLNYMKVSRSMNQLVSEMHSNETSSAGVIRTSLEKHLDVESVDYPAIKDFEIRRDGSVWIVQTSYEESAPLFSNISLVVAFDKTVQIQ